MREDGRTKLGQKPTPVEKKTQVMCTNKKAHRIGKASLRKGTLRI